MCNTCRTRPDWFVKALEAHQQNLDYIYKTPPQPRFPCPACGKETKVHHEGTRICSNRNCRLIIAKKPDPYPPLSWIPDDAPAKNERKLELLEQRLRPFGIPATPHRQHGSHPRNCECVDCRYERSLPAPTPPVPVPDRLHLLVEWMELKREVALVCRLWRAWFGGVWHST